jgi:5-methylcytosine-specific restriction enzyme A
MRSWCSDACYEYVAIRADPGYARRKVARRDKGICADCGRDCLALERELRSLRYDRRMKPERFDQRIKELQAEGFTVDRYYERTLWEADHIVPVIEGGGECDLDNLRTLCTPCHKRVTKEMHARLASARKPPQPPSPQLELSA